MVPPTIQSGGGWFGRDPVSDDAVASVVTEIAITITTQVKVTSRVPARHFSDNLSATGAHIGGAITAGAAIFGSLPAIIAIPRQRALRESDQR